MVKQFYNEVFKKGFDPEYEDLTLTQRTNLAKSLMFQSYELEKSVLTIKSRLLNKFKRQVQL